MDVAFYPLLWNGFCLSRCQEPSVDGALFYSEGVVKIRKKVFFTGLLFLLALWPSQAFAMHIMEGFLPLKWALFWTVAALPFLIAGFKATARLFAANPEYKMLLALTGAFVFVLSALKMPSVTGSCSHPTGIGLGTILFGPVVMSVVSAVVLVFQALLLAHGGLSTLGANVFSMGVAGPLVAFTVYLLAQKASLSRSVSVFLASALAVLSTYLATSLQMALAFPMASGGVAASFSKFAAIFALTQLPLALSEGILTVIIFNVLYSYNREEVGGLLTRGRDVGQN